MDAIWKSTTGRSDTSPSQSTQSLLNDKLVEKIIYMALPASNDLATDTIAVSYTHLDVYKRQVLLIFFFG